MSLPTFELRRVLNGYAWWHVQADDWVRNSKSNPLVFKERWQADLYIERRYGL